MLSTGIEVAGMINDGPPESLPGKAVNPMNGLQSTCLKSMAWYVDHYADLHTSEFEYIYRTNAYTDFWLRGASASWPF